MGDNGSGNGGGNTSVYWEMRHGKVGSEQPPGSHNGPTPVPRGTVKVHNYVEGHSDDEFDDIGRGQHPGLFKVVLRYKADVWSKVPATEKTGLAELEKLGIVQLVIGDRILTLHVPAIKRTWPQNGTWGDMPWEIHWEW
jgi:hypothetical protein